jgi:hypothetical protein
MVPAVGNRIETGDIPMAATLKKPRKAAKRKGRTNKATTDGHAPVDRTSGDIAQELAKARMSDALHAWDQSTKTRAMNRVSQLESELEAAQLAEMPPADPLTFKVTERDVELAKIDVTGNHREQLEDPTETQRLSRSLLAVGLQQRIGVRDAGKGRFELIFGSRRRAAAMIAGWKEIPAKIYPTETTPAQVELLRDIENFNRKDLTPVERAIAVARTIDAVDQLAVPKSDDGRQMIRRIEAAGGRDAYVGQLLGYPASWVRDHAYVSKLGGKARELLASRRINIEHARELAKLGDVRLSDDFAERAAKSTDGTGGSTPSDVRNWVNEELRSLKSVPWRLDVPVKGKCSLPVACDGCQFNSKSDPLLFEHETASNGDGKAEDVAMLASAGVCGSRCCGRSRTPSNGMSGRRSGRSSGTRAVRSPGDSTRRTAAKARCSGCCIGPPIG